MYRYLFFILLSVICIQCRNEKKPFTLTGDIATDLNALLGEGSMEVEVMDSVVKTAREMELMYRMKEATDKNPGWYDSYLTQYKDQRVPPYHPNFGLNEQEYQELVGLRLTLNVVPSLKQTIKVVREKETIRFEADGKLPYLEEILINTHDNKIAVKNYTLTFTDTIFVANENNALKSMWKGYSWRFDVPAIDDTLSQLLNTQHYNISIGLLYKTGQTLISISEREETDGERTLKLDKPLLLRKD
jgi:hypothetical protein